MKLLHSLVQRTVVLLLVFVLGFSFFGVGVGLARVELHEQSGNVDGDPGEGFESDGGGGVGGGVNVQPRNEEELLQANEIPFFWCPIGFIGLQFFEEDYFFWISDTYMNEAFENRGQK